MSSEPHLVGGFTWHKPSEQMPVPHISLHVLDALKLITRVVISFNTNISYIICVLKPITTLRGRGSP